MVAKVDQTPSALAKVSPMLANFSNKNGQRQLEVGSKSTNAGQLWPTSAQICPTSANSGRNVGRCLPTAAKFMSNAGQFVPNPGGISAPGASVRQPWGICSATVGQLWSSLGSLGITFLDMWRAHVPQVPGNPIMPALTGISTDAAAITTLCPSDPMGSEAAVGSGDICVFLPGAVSSHRHPARSCSCRPPGPKLHRLL